MLFFFQLYFFGCHRRCLHIIIQYRYLSGKTQSSYNFSIGFVVITCILLERIPFLFLSINSSSFLIFALFFIDSTFIQVFIHYLNFCFFSYYTYVFSFISSIFILCLSLSLSVSLCLYYNIPNQKHIHIPNKHKNFLNLF